MIFSEPPQFRAMLHVNLEHPLEQLDPAQPHRAVVLTVRLALNGLCFLGGRLGCLRHLSSPLGACTTTPAGSAAHSD